MLNCSGKACPVRFKADVAYTPRYDTTITERQWLSTGFAFGQQSRVGQVVLWCEVNETKLGLMFAAHRDVTAWFVVRCGKDVTFQTAEVDMDASKGHIVRSARDKVNIHSGRLFLFKERATPKTNSCIFARCGGTKRPSWPP